MIDVAICICTRRRQEGLKSLLESLNRLVVPSDTVVRVIVVENDNEKRSEEIVMKISQRTGLRADYFLETKKGVVHARNRSVREAGDCDFCCFTDDDEVVGETWLTELLRCQKEFDAGGVAGPTFPSFDRKVPSYIKKFHQPKTAEYGAVVESAFTGCLLLKKKYLDMVEGPFNSSLNFSGGEDSLLTKKITSLGGVIRYNPAAIAYEMIPGSRATVRYVLREVFRTSNTELSIKSLKDPDFTRSGALPRLILRFGYGLLVVLPFFIFGKEDRLKGLIKITNAIGGFAFILGRQSRFYK